MLAMLRTPPAIPLLLAMLVAACGGATPEDPPAPSPASSPGLPQQVVHELEQAQRDTARVEAQQLRAAAELHVLRTGACPASIEALVEARELDRARPDPWGRAYVLSCTDAGRTIAVSSLGPDAQAGTDDDVTVDAEGG